MALLRDSVQGSDGTRIEFAVAGSGPALVMSNGLTTTDTFWKYLRAQLSPHYTVITWDLPGHGASEPARTDATCEIEAQPGLLLRILDKVGVERAVHLGFSVGCQIVLESMRQYPSRWDALGLMFGTAGHVLSTSELPVSGPTLLRLLRYTPDRHFAWLFQNFARLADHPLNRNIGRTLGLLGRNAPDADLAEVTRHLNCIDPKTMRRMAASAEAHSAYDLLPTLDLPVLILAGSRDPFAPEASVCGPMHRAVRGSEYLRIEGATHTALLEQPDLIARVLSDFLERRVPGFARPPLAAHSG